MSRRDLAASGTRSRHAFWMNGCQQKKVPGRRRKIRPVRCRHGGEPLLPIPDMCGTRSWFLQYAACVLPLVLQAARRDAVQGGNAPLQGSTVTQAWSSAPGIPCFTMSYEFHAPPPRATCGRVTLPRGSAAMRPPAQRKGVFSFQKIALEPIPVWLKRGLHIKRRKALLIHCHSLRCIKPAKRHR